MSKEALRSEMDLVVSLVYLFCYVCLFICVDRIPDLYSCSGGGSNEPVFFEAAKEDDEEDEKREFLPNSRVNLHSQYKCRRHYETASFLCPLSGEGATVIGRPESGFIRHHHQPS